MLVITEIKLSEDYDHIVATAQMSKDADRMLREDTLFWVVKPRIGREGISGLDTLLSGAYIQLQPGTASSAQDHFKVMDLPPIAPPDAKGLRLVLTNKAGKLNVGDQSCMKDSPSAEWRVPSLMWKAKGSVPTLYLCPLR